MAENSRLAERNERLKAAIDAYAETAYGSNSDSELSESRSLALDRYLGTNINPAPEGRSQVRDRTTFEVVEWTKPSLLRIFTSGSEVARFDPIGPEDEKQAEQETDYVNHVVLQKNNWHQVCNDWFTDALILKNGYAYAYWDETKSTESEFYENLTDDAFALLAQDREVDIVGHDQRPNEELDARNQQAYQQAQQQYAQMQQQMQMRMQQQPPQPGQPPPQMPPPPQPPQPTFLHDVELKRTRKRGQVKICTLAPERCLIDVNTTDHTLAGASYFEWFDWKTIGDLRAAGLEVPDDISDSGDDDPFDSPEESSRDLYSEDWNREGDEPDPALRRVRVRYIWIRYDYDKDGINELQYVVRVGSEILYRKECEEIPVASISPIPLAHRHVGMSLADSVADIEDVNTNITRQAIDNLNLSNTPRIAASDRVNMADLLDVRVGGVVRIDGQPPQEFMPIVVPNVFPDAVQALSFFDSRRQNRTGINAYFQGTDANTLNKTASGISQLTNSAAQRVEMIARNFASGVERLFLIVHRLILQHGHAAEVFRLRNEWVTVDPAQWRKRTDVRISVGLGTGNKDSQIAQLMQMFQVQMATLPTGVSNPNTLYATVVEIAKAAGFPTPEKFVNDPKANPPPQPGPPPEIMAAQITAQAQQQIAQMKAQLDAQVEQMKMQAEAAQAQQQMAFDKWKAELDAQTKITVEQIKAGLTREVESAKIMSTEQVKAAELSLTEREHEKREAENETGNQVAAQLNAVTQAVAQLAEMMDGKRVVGVEKVRDPKTGKMVASRVRRADGSTDEVTIQ